MSLIELFFGRLITKEAKELNKALLETKRDLKEEIKDLKKRLKPSVNNFKDLMRGQIIPKEEGIKIIEEIIKPSMSCGK